MNLGKAIILFMIMTLASCSVVKQNGYYQSRKYKMKQVRLFQNRINPQQTKAPKKHEELELNAETIEPIRSIQSEIIYPDKAPPRIELAFEKESNTVLAFEAPKIERSDSNQVEKIYQRDVGHGVRLSLLAYFIILTGAMFTYFLNVFLLGALCNILAVVILIFAIKSLNKGIAAIRKNPDKYKGLVLAHIFRVFDLLYLSSYALAILIFLFILLLFVIY